MSWPHTKAVVIWLLAGPGTRTGHAMLAHSLFADAPQLILLEAAAYGPMRRRGHRHSLAIGRLLKYARQRR